MVVENLRRLLYPYSPNYPIHFGHLFKMFVGQSYMSGGAGYVLSKEALKRFIEVALPNESLCRQDNGGFEDLEMGKCLVNVNVTSIDSRDSNHRMKFFVMSPQHALFPRELCPKWYWEMAFYEPKEGLNCCSDYAISFHKISPQQLYLLEYLIYDLRPYGIVRDAEPLQKKITQDEMKVVISEQSPSWVYNY